jgi:hypothetical protein
MLLREVEPDTDGTFGIHLELSVALDVAELRRRRIVEREHHRTLAGGDVDALVDQLCHGDRTIAMVVQHFERVPEARLGDRVHRVGVGHEMHHQHGHPAHRGIGSRCDRPASCVGSGGCGGR